MNLCLNPFNVKSLILTEKKLLLERSGKLSRLNPFNVKSLILTVSPIEQVKQWCKRSLNPFNVKSLILTGEDRGKEFSP